MTHMKEFQTVTFLTASVLEQQFSFKAHNNLGKLHTYKTEITVDSPALFITLIS